MPTCGSSWRWTGWHRGGAGWFCGTGQDWVWTIKAQVTGSKGPQVRCRVLPRAGNVRTASRFFRFRVASGCILSLKSRWRGAAISNAPPCSQEPFRVFLLHSVAFGCLETGQRSPSRKMVPTTSEYHDGSADLAMSWRLHHVFKEIRAGPGE